MTILALAIALVLPQEPEKKVNTPPALEEVFRFTERGVVGFDFAPTGTTLAVGGDGYVATLDLQTFKFVNQVGQEDLVDEVLFDPQGLRLISRSKTPDIVIRLLGDLAPIKFALDVPPSEGPLDPVAPVAAAVRPTLPGSCPAAFSRDGRRLALVNGRRGFRMWGLDGLAGDRKAVLELHFETAPIRAPAKSDDGFGRRIGVPHVMLNHLTALAFEGDRLWVGMEDGFVMPINPDWFKSLDDPTGKDFKRPPGRNGSASRYLTLKEARVFQPHAADVTSVVFLPGDRQFVTAGLEGKIGIWSTKEVLDRKPPASDLDRPKEPKPVKILNGYYVSLSPDARFLAVAESGGIRCYDRESLEPVSWNPTPPKMGRPSRVKFSRDGSLMAATICACATCAKANVIYTQALPKMRSHHHGGALIVWKTAEPPAPSK